MDSKVLSRYKIFSELTEEKAAEWFDYSPHKFINHIDTLYYVVYPAIGEWRTNDMKLNFCGFLRSVKEAAESCGDPQNVFEDIAEGIEVRPFFGFGFYALHFGKQDFFDVFVAESPPNKDTPPVFVQLRSNYLWTKGVKESFDESVGIIERILDSFGIKISRIQENRIDYAYHTNYIQDLLNFFPERHLKDMQISDFERANKEYYFFDCDVFSDYFALGRRKSNNVFIRCYNKSKEVIELGYKQFFVNLWYDCGMISQYDKFLLEKAFVYGKYDAVQKARCAWYMCYGENPAIKLEILQLNENPDTPARIYKKLADQLVPDLTVVCNFEFQTKRKYYDRLDIPLITTETGAKQSIYNIFECYQTILDKLTCGGDYDKNGCIKFIKYKGDWAEVQRLKRPIASWWKLLQNCKSYELGGDLNFDILRKYQISLDAERRKNCALSGIASNVAYYKKAKDTPFENDLYDLVLSLNDNDLRYYNRNKIKKYNELKKKGLILDDETL